MNYERFGKKEVVTKSRYYPGTCLEGLQKTSKKTSVIIAGISAEIRTQHLDNIILEPYPFSNPLGISLPIQTMH
jgi:hypothetical protein